MKYITSKTVGALFLHLKGFAPGFYESMSLICRSEKDSEKVSEVSLLTKINVLGTTSVINTVLKT